METTDNISISRNISKVDEMQMTKGEYILKAEVDSADGKVRNINNGQITNAQGMYVGSFYIYNGNSTTVSIQDVHSRQERMAIYEIVDDFANGVNLTISGENTAAE